ncbi:MAG: hypothetical protein ACR2NJ_09500 [Acidimicrobiales bacterium]
MNTLTISCDECEMQHTSVCEGCVVTFILGHEPEDAVVIDANEARAVRMLGRAGLVPPLRHRRIRTTTGRDTAVEAVAVAQRG